MMKGYTGKILRVNLTTATTTFEEVPAAHQRSLIGGTGLGLRYAYDEIPPSGDTFSEKNKLIFMTGPLTGTDLGTTGRYQLVYRSPLTGILCDSSASGVWAVELKRAGYDGLIVEGISDRFVYLSIDDGKVGIRDAAHLVGKDTYQTQETLRGELGQAKASIMSLGLAGENRVPYSCVMSDSGRVPGRGGNGALMGSKRLKAIVVGGSGKIGLHDPEGYHRLAVRINKLNAQDPRQANLRQFGTSWVLDSLWTISNVPTRNWSMPSDESLCTRLGGARLKSDYMPHPHRACYRCTIGCARWSRIKEGPYALDAPGPEYETLASLGSLCLIDDLEAVIYANHLCNRYGIDTMSFGVSLAFAMECFEKGTLTTRDTDGVDLRWGNAQALVDLVGKVARQEGFGAFLAQGTRRMASVLGSQTDEFAMHVKGLEMPMHDARSNFAWASNYATSPRGACHVHGMTSWYEERQDPIPEWGFTGLYPRLSDPGKGRMTRFAQDWAHLVDSLVICYFASRMLQPSDLAALLNAATGTSYGALDLLEIGDRINALYRAYNVRCGIRHADDRLPLRALTPLKEGFSAGRAPNLEDQLKEYYRERQWNEHGIPTRECLKRLGLVREARDLHGD